MYRPVDGTVYLDYLSRNPINCLSMDITTEWIKVTQLQDNHIDIIRKILEGDNVYPKVKQEKYGLKDIIFRKIKNRCK